MVLVSNRRASPFGVSGLFFLFFLRHRPTRRLGVVIEVVAPGLATVCSRCICAGVGFNPLRDPQGVVLFRGVSVPSCVVVVVSVVVVVVFFWGGGRARCSPMASPFANRCIERVLASRFGLYFCSALL